MSGNSSVSRRASAAIPNATSAIIVTTVMIGRRIAKSEMNMASTPVATCLPACARSLEPDQHGRNRRLTPVRHHRLTLLIQVTQAPDHGSGVCEVVELARYCVEQRGRYSPPLLSPFPAARGGRQMKKRHLAIWWAAGLATVLAAPHVITRQLVSSTNGLGSLTSPVSDITAKLASAITGKHLGFDTSEYPGDNAMATWKRDAPYEWVGYYLSAPCHRDDGWSGKR